MKILHIVTWFSNYNSIVLKEGVFHYDQVKYQNTLIDSCIYFPFDKSINSSFCVEEKDGIKIYRSKIKFRFLKYIQFLLDFKKILKDFNPDIIHGHVGNEAGKLTYLLCSIFKLPYLITEHNPIEFIDVEKNKNIKILKKVYANSKFNLCVSNYQRDKLKEIFPEINFMTICNGVYQPELFINKEFKINKNSEINCCIVAAFYDKYIKGFQFLLPALKKLLEENYSINLHICGGGEYLDFYRSLSEQLKINKNCFFYGQCKKGDVYSVINQCDFLISASLFESAGISVEEALLLGKPVLVTKSGGADSLVNDTNSIIVEKGSTDDLIEGIKTIILNINNFNSNDIKEYAKNNFNIEIVNNRIIDLYKDIILE